MTSLKEFRTLLCSLSMELHPESVPLSEAQGRFPTEPIASPIDLPPMDAADSQVKRGRYLKAGEDFVFCGRLGAAEIASLATAGISRVMVRRVINVGFLRIRESPGGSVDAANPDGVYSSAGYMLKTLVSGAGAWPVDYGVYPGKDAALPVVEKGLAECPVFIACGEDPGYLREFLSGRGGELLCDGLAVEGGEKLLFGRIMDDQGQTRAFLFSFPSGPVPSFLFFYLVVRPFLYSLNGGDDPGLWMRCPLKNELCSPAGSSAGIVPVRLSPEADASLAVEVLTVEGADHCTGLMGADGCVVLAAGSGKYAAGSPVDVLIFR